MGCNPMYCDGESVGGRGADDHPAKPAGIQGIAEFGPDMFRVEGLGAEQADLFTGGEDKLDRAECQIMFPENPNRFNQGGDT